MPSDPEKPGGRLQQARQAAQRLVDLLETGVAPIEQALMIAQRLARLLRDVEAQRWLDYEMSGYPDKASEVAPLGHCAKYALRFFKDGAVYDLSLPALETLASSAEQVFKNMK